jgi:excisionase family DNA binding protein
MDTNRRLTLSVTEAAEVLGISRALAYELVARGELPSLQFGRRLVVPWRAIERLLASCEDTDTTESEAGGRSQWQPDRKSAPPLRIPREGLG